MCIYQITFYDGSNSVIKIVMHHNLDIYNFEEVHDFLKDLSNRIEIVRCPVFGETK